MGDERMEKFFDTAEAAKAELAPELVTGADKQVEASPPAADSGYMGERFASTIRATTENLGWRQAGSDLKLPTTGLEFNDGAKLSAESGDLGPTKLSVPVESLRKLVLPEIFKRLEEVVDKLDGSVELTAQLTPANFYINGVRVDDSVLQSEIYSVVQIYYRKYRSWGVTEPVEKGGTE